MRRSIASRRLSWPSIDVLPQRGVGVLEVGEPHLRAGVERVDGHLAVGRAGDLGAAVDQAGGVRRDPPGVVLADVLGLGEEVEAAAAGDLLVARGAGSDQLAAARVEGPVQAGEEVERLVGQHLVVAVVDRSVDADAVEGCSCLHAPLRSEWLVGGVRSVRTAASARPARSRSSSAARPWATARSGSRSVMACAATTPRSRRPSRAGVVELEPAGEDDDRDTVRRRTAGDPHGGLAAEALLVERALAGHDQVGARQSARRTRPGRAPGRCPGPAGRRAAPSRPAPTPPAAPGPGRGLDVGARVAAQHVGQPPQPLRRAPGPRSGPAPFCGAKTAAAPRVAGQRVVDVAGDHDLDGVQPRRPGRWCRCGPGRPARGRRAAAPGPSVSRKRTPSAAARPVPPSVDALPPMPSTIRVGARVQGGADQLAGAAAARRQGGRHVAAAAGQQGQAGGGGQLDDRARADVRSDPPPIARPRRPGRRAGRSR